MAKHDERLKKALMEVYSKPELTSEEIYDQLIYRNSDENIVSEYNDSLYILSLYLYYKNNNLQDLTKQVLPFKIERGLSFNDFWKEVEKYKDYKFENTIIQNDTYFSLICRALGNRRKIRLSDGWKSIQKSELEGTKTNENSSIAYRLYLPIANESLEFFAMHLLAKCAGRGIEYDFKINNASYLSRSDNVVIYATLDNVAEYIKIINEIIDKYPKIKINYDEQHLLACPYSDYISIAPYIDSNGESFSSIICNEIYGLRRQSVSFQDFYQNVIAMINNYLNKVDVNKIKGK